MKATDLPCHGAPVVFMFDARQDGRYWRRVDIAKRLCATCPVRQACLDRWLSNDWDADGNREEVIVGGTTKIERDAMRGRGVATDHEHGTVAGHSAHLRRGTVPCRDCRDAYNRHQRGRRLAGAAA